MHVIALALYKSLTYLLSVGLQCDVCYAVGTSSHVEMMEICAFTTGLMTMIRCHIVLETLFFVCVLRYLCHIISHKRSTLLLLM